jgi:hypothetical protein
MAIKNQPNIFSLLLKLKPIKDSFVGKAFVNPINKEIPENISNFAFNLRVASFSILLIFPSYV